MNWSEIDWVELVGQCFGIMAFIIAFLAYQAKTSKKLLMVQSAAIFSAATTAWAKAWRALAKTRRDERHL